MAKKAKNKSGQPTKYKPEYVKIAEDLCGDEGYADKDLAIHFKITETTLYRWKNKYSEFCEAIKKGKDDFDSRVVEQSLLKRALGYTYEEITKEPFIVVKGVLKEGDVKEGETVEQAVEKSLAVTKVVTKQVAPDVVAQIFWLKNRQPHRWSDKKEIDHRIEGITKPLTEEELLDRLEQARSAGTGIDVKSIEGNGNGHSE